MVHKVLPARAAVMPQPRLKHQGWAGPSRLASASFSADVVSRSSTSSGACASMLLPPGDRNPKSIKVRRKLPTRLGTLFAGQVESQARRQLQAQYRDRGIAAVYFGC